MNRPGLLIIAIATIILSAATWYTAVHAGKQGSSRRIIRLSPSWRIIIDASGPSFFPFPYIDIFIFMGWEITVGWLQVSITLSYLQKQKSKNHE